MHVVQWPRGQLVRFTRGQAHPIHMPNIDASPAMIMGSHSVSHWSSPTSSLGGAKTMVVPVAML
jgi:hypothetical protein